MINKKPKVSIIVPVYNREKKVLFTLDSIVNNKYRPLELLLINDGSSDNSLRILKEFKTKNESEVFEIKIYSQENKGAPTARNKGMQEATGEFFQFIDSDDTIATQKITSQINALIKENTRVAICDFCYVYENEKTKKCLKNNKNLLYKMAKNHGINVSTPLFHYSFYEKGLLWDTSLKRNQDIDFVFKLLLMTKKYIYTEGYWCYYKIHNKDQISNSYKISPPEFKKRIKSLIKFGFKKFNMIYLNNYFYLLLGVVALYRQYVLYKFKKNTLNFY